MVLRGSMALELALLLMVASAAGHRLSQPRSRTVVCLARKPDDTAGRGFGAVPEKARPEKTPGKAKSPPPAASQQGLVDDSRAASESRGRAALERLRRDYGAPAPPPRGMQLTPEELEPLSPEAGVMPEAVSNRMLRRVVPFAGLPVFGSVVVFGGFWFANTQLGYDLPPSMVAYSTQALLLLSFAGITYGVMSTSWDEEEEGTLLGFKEAARNTKLALGDAKQAQAAAVAEVAEEIAQEEAAAKGIIMSKKALEKQQGGGDRR